MSVTRSDNQERLRRQKSRSIAIGLALGALVLLFYAATIVRLGPNALRREGTSHGPRPAGAVTAPAAPAIDCKKAGTC